MEEEMHEDDYGMLEVAFSSLAIAHYATTPESKDIYYEPILRKLFLKHCKTFLCDKRMAWWRWWWHFLRDLPL